MVERTQRRLAAIVSADVVGYSRLMGADETGTIAALRTHRAEMIDAKIAEHGGRIVKTMGDGLLLEFPSVVDATQCVIEVQSRMAARNQDVAVDQQIIFRIGVNLGDIIIDGDDILGDGVNIAARLQESAEPGGVAVSQRVYDDIRDRLDAPFANGGELALKNIARPVQVWRWSSNTAQPQTSPVDSARPLLLRRSEKPCIAVLPFENMSADPEQEYFSDGISEDIISSLEYMPWFSVVARGSSFSFKGEERDIRRAAEELGAQYVLDGSVRKAGQRIRISARLIDTHQERSVWTQRYDRELTDVFDLQDEITEQIVGAVAPEFMAAEMQRARHKETRDLDAWDLLMKAHWHLNRFSREDNEVAKRLLGEVVALDPKNDLAFSDLATSYVIGLPWGWYEKPQEMLDAALDAAGRAIDINERNVSALLSRAYAEAFTREFDTSVRRARQAVALAPTSPDAHGWFGVCLTHACEWSEAQTELDLAFRLGPRNPLNAMWAALMQLVLFSTGKYEECIRLSEKILDELPVCLPAVHRPMAASFAMLDRPREAAAALKELKIRVPNATAETVRNFPFKDPVAIARYAEAMEKAEVLAAAS